MQIKVKIKGTVYDVDSNSFSMEVRNNDVIASHDFSDCQMVIERPQETIMKMGVVFDSTEKCKFECMVTKGIKKAEVALIEDGDITVFKMKKCDVRVESFSHELNGTSTSYIEVKTVKDVKSTHIVKAWWM